MEISEKSIEKLAEEKIKIGNNLISYLSELKHIPGVNKIQNKISAEILSLQRVRRSMKIQHILIFLLNEILFFFQGNKFTTTYNQPHPMFKFKLFRAFGENFKRNRKCKRS